MSTERHMARHQVTHHDVEVGPGVELDCGRVSIGRGCRLGVVTPELFRRVPGVRIECEELELGPGSVVEPSVFIRGGSVRLGSGCRLGTGLTVNVRDRLELGKGSVLGQDCTIEGRRVVLGREAWLGPQVRIGGGSAYESQSELVSGFWLHLGMRCFVNTAEKVSIGNEVGIGTNSAVFTHGAYQSAARGFPVSFAPVTIGDNAWIPGAVVNPGVEIGPNAVIGVGSVVTRSVPAGALAAGVPCRVIRENAFPGVLSPDERRQVFARVFARIATALAEFTGHPAQFDPTRVAVRIPEREVSFRENVILVRKDSGESTEFRFDDRVVNGPADPLTEKLRDLLRRHGIRFFAETESGRYRDWRDG